MRELLPLLDMVALVGLDIVELDHDKPAVFTFYYREPDQAVLEHKAVVSRLAGVYDRATSMFSPRFFEVVCHTCSDVELLSIANIDEMIDPVTGEMLTVDEIAARLPVGRLIPAR